MTKLEVICQQALQRIQNFIDLEAERIKALTAQEVQHLINKLLSDSDHFP